MLSGRTDGTENIKVPCLTYLCGRSRGELTKGAFRARGRNKIGGGVEVENPRPGGRVTLCNLIGLPIGKQPPKKRGPKER